MIKEKKNTKMISHSGKLLNPTNQSGLLLGEREDLDGISSARRWQVLFSENS